MDISDAYNFQTNDNNKVMRKIIFDKESNKVQIEDNIELKEENTIYSMFNVAKNAQILVKDGGKIAELKQNVLQDDGSYKEEKLRLEIKSADYEWTIINKEPIEDELKDITNNMDFKYNISTEKEKKLCIKVNNAKILNIIIEIQ